MSKYVRSHPKHQPEVDPQLYAFDSPSDYLAFEKSEFATPEEFHEFIEDFYNTDWTSVHASVSLSDRELSFAYDSALAELRTRRSRPAVRPSLSYERELIEEYLNGDIGEEDSEVQCLVLDGRFYPLDTNIALDSHIEAKALHADRRTRTIRAINRRIRFAHEGLESFFELPSTKHNPCKHYSIGSSGFIFKRYQEAIKKFSEYNHIIAVWSWYEDKARVLGNAALSSLDRKRCAETIRRLKGRVRFARYYDEFSAKEGRYLKRKPLIEGEDSTSSCSAARDCELSTCNNMPLHNLSYVNKPFAVTCKSCGKSHILQKKLSETHVPLVLLPFQPHHLVNPFR